MRFLRRTALPALLLIVGCGRETSDVKWAREVAGHFLDAFAGKDLDSVKAVSTRRYQNELTTISISGGPLGWSIQSHETSPNGDQLIFKGILDFKGALEKRSFTLMMEKENDRWLVSSFSQGDLVHDPTYEKLKQERKDKDKDKWP